MVIVPAAEEARRSPDCTDEAVLDLTGLRGISLVLSELDMASLFARLPVIMRSTGDFGESVESRAPGWSDRVVVITLSVLDKLLLLPDILLRPSSLGAVFLDASCGNAVAPTVSSAMVARVWAAPGMPGRLGGPVFVPFPVVVEASADPVPLNVEPDTVIVERVGEEIDGLCPTLVALEPRRETASWASALSASWAGLEAAPPPTTSLNRL